PNTLPLTASSTMALVPWVPQSIPRNMGASDSFGQQVFQGLADPQFLQAVEIVLKSGNELGGLRDGNAENFFDFQQALSDQHVIGHQRLAECGARIDNGISHA